MTLDASSLQAIANLINVKFIQKLDPLQTSMGHLEEKFETLQVGLHSRVDTLEDDIKKEMQTLTARIQTLERDRDETQGAAQSSHNEHSSSTARIARLEKRFYC